MKSKRFPTLKREGVALGQQPDHHGLGPGIIAIEPKNRKQPGAYPSNQGPTFMSGIEMQNPDPTPIRIAKQEKHEPRGVDDFLKPRGKKGSGGRGR